MKEWICREMSTSTDNSENGVLMIEKELIRCKDCVKYKMFGDGYCPWIEQTVEEDFFCADGCAAERKDDETA